MTDFSRDPDSTLSAARAQRYRGVLFEQGTPVLDRDLNLLGDLVDAAVRDVLRRYAGDGLVGSPEAFEVTLSSSQASWKKAKLHGPGTMLVGGREITISQPVVYDEQLDLRSERSSLLAMWEKIWSRTLGESEKQALRELLQGAGAVEDVPDDASEVLLYLDVWDTIIDAVLDPALGNAEDVGVQTSRRRLSVWRVRATTGTSLPEAPRGHDFVRLAAIKAALRQPVVGGRAPVGVNQWKISDFRRFGLQQTVERLSWTDGSQAVRSEFRDQELSLKMQASDPRWGFAVKVAGDILAQDVHASSLNVARNDVGPAALRLQNKMHHITVDASGLGQGTSTGSGRTTTFLDVRESEAGDSFFALGIDRALYLGGGSHAGVLRLRDGEGQVAAELDTRGLRCENGEIVGASIRSRMLSAGPTIVKYLPHGPSLQEGQLIGLSKRGIAVPCERSRRASVVGVFVDPKNIEGLVLGNKDGGVVPVAVGGVVRVRVEHVGTADAGLAVVPSPTRDGVGVIAQWSNVTPGVVLGKLVRPLDANGMVDAEVMLCLG